MRTYAVIRERVETRARAPDIVRTGSTVRVVRVEDELRPVKRERTGGSSGSDFLQLWDDLSKLSRREPAERDVCWER